LMWVGRHAAWLIAAGLLMAILIPINKRLWTPSFTVLSLGTSCAWFALLIWLIDLRHRRWLTPLQELGANPIAVYVAFMAVRAIVDDYRDAAPFIAPFGSEATGTMLYCLAWLLAGWYLAHQLVRKRVYVKL
jgi:predicted acyltransferase